MSGVAKPKLPGGGAFVYYVIMFGVALYGSWLATYLWSWFVTPTFGLAVPSVFTLAGIELLIGMLWPLGGAVTKMANDILDEWEVPSRGLERDVGRVFLVPLLSITISTMLFFNGWVMHMLGGGG